MATAYDTALLALNECLSSTNRTQRKEAEDFLMTLKNSNEFFPILTHILSVDDPKHNEYIRTLSLTLLFDWIEIWWNKLSDVDQLSTRVGIMSFLNGGLATSRNKGLRSKLAQILSNLAERQ